MEAPASTHTRSDDTPIVTHARSLKRKHRPDDRPVAVREDADARQGTPRQPVRVKEEQFRSPVPEKSPVLTRKETLDLDTLGGTIETPRKRRRMEEIMRLSQHGRLRAPALLNLRHERSTSLPVEVKYSFNGKFFPTVEQVLDDRAISEPAGAIVPSFRKPEEDGVEKRQPGNVLRPLSTNVPVLPRTDDGTRRSKSRKNDDRGGRHVPSVAEDGEAIVTLTGKHAKSTKQATRRTPARTAKKSPEAKRDAEGRLRSLLEEQSPTKKPLSAIMTPASIRQSLPPATAPSRSTARPKDRDPKRARPDDEPLRARPLARLGLEDFKINPAHNQNLDYAFAESVRTRDGKRCLPNCTKPECCGDKFRKIVAIGGALPGPAAGLFSSSQEGDGDDDERLADHLGDDHRARLGRMSDAERTELLLQAHAKQAADTFGKHRQAFVRRTSPAGYWRTDMPSTQEMEQDRAEAGKMERAKVEERYAEAMREGGRWLFRDE
ncbi:DNA repair protein endonuclease SAE2/CtIP C-terminus-domain-containing protein [Cryomyces antarcticus]